MGCCKENDEGGWTEDIDVPSIGSTRFYMAHSATRPPRLREKKAKAGLDTVSTMSI